MKNFENEMINFLKSEYGNENVILERYNVGRDTHLSITIIYGKTSINFSFDNESDYVDIWFDSYKDAFINDVLTSRYIKDYKEFLNKKSLLSELESVYDFCMSF